MAMENLSTTSSPILPSDSLTVRPWCEGPWHKSWVSGCLTSWTDTPSTINWFLSSCPVSLTRWQRYGRRQMDSGTMSVSQLVMQLSSFGFSRQGSPHQTSPVRGRHIRLLPSGVATSDFSRQGSPHQTSPVRGRHIRLLPSGVATSDFSRQGSPHQTSPVTGSPHHIFHL